MKNASQTQRLKIAIVSDAVYPYNKGGKEKRFYEISTRLASRGHEVTIYCMKWWKEETNIKVENGVRLKAISRYHPLYSGKRRSFREAIFFALACFKLVKEDFDVIDVDHMPHFVLFSTRVVTWIKGKKLTASWNEVWGKAYWNEYLGPIGTLAYFLEWISAQLPDQFISISSSTTHKLKTVLNVKKPIYTAPIGVDVAYIEKITPALEQSDIIFAGRLLSHKNVSMLIEAIALVKMKLPNVKALIIGEGPEKAKIIEQIKTLKLEKNVIHKDFLKDHRDLYALMKSSKVLAFPSTREGFGTVALEANACNIPVVTIDDENNATKDLITQGKNGSVIPLNAKDLADTLLHFIKNKPGNYSDFVKLYAWDAIAKHIEEVYQS